MFDILLCSIRNIGRKKTRSFLTAIGVAIGVASVVLIGNISQSGSFAINNELDSLGLDGLTVSASTRTADMEKKPLYDQHLDVIKKSEYVKQAMPLITRNAEVSCHNLQTNALVFGVNENANKIISLNTLHGRSINKSDVCGGSNVCIVDQKFSQKFYSRNNVIGKKILITLNLIPEVYEIVGVVKTGTGLIDNVLGNYIPNFVYIPYTSVQKITGTKTFDQIAVKINDKFNLPIEEVGAKLAQSLENHCKVYDKYISNNLSKQRDGLIRLLDIIAITLSIVGAISLIVASLSIMIVMLVSVGERTREIGIKKSIGASRISIMVEFLLEAIIITLIGSILGILMGNSLFFVGSKIFGFQFTIKIENNLLGFIFATSTGLIFGIYPAIKASKMNPVDALKFA
ncbi:MAG: ABC transporter permease [Oscillospiraceae bacterium]|jgi:putative ABC transport system permease protein|nr:ABC transporter permease [Oscillospiraceae bacterium]